MLKRIKLLYKASLISTIYLARKNGCKVCIINDFAQRVVGILDGEDLSSYLIKDYENVLKRCWEYYINDPEIAAKCAYNGMRKMSGKLLYDFTNQLMDDVI